MSGFLRGADRAPSKLMRSRDSGRVFFFGICPDKRVLGHVAAYSDAVASAFEEMPDGLEAIGVFLNLETVRQGGADPRQMLLDSLYDIHRKGWIPSRKIGKTGVAEPYSARNGGGYTLEAELGISPNGYAEPDFLGWEVKQYGVRNFVSYSAKSSITLMTPEPTGGIYKEEGVEEFLRRYGYSDKSGKHGRINFGGIHAVDRDHHPDTGLALRMTGFNLASGQIMDVNGAIVLLDHNENIAASWPFKGIIEHWNRKHAKAVYVPSLMRYPPPEYRYGAVVQLCEGTDVLLLLRAFASGAVYYDPGTKMEKAHTDKPTIKRRSQFRVNHRNLRLLYNVKFDQDLVQ